MLIDSRRNRRTGATIDVSTAADEQLDSTSGPYVTICRTHGAILNSRTKAQAIAARAYPEWCQGCQAIMAGNQPIPAIVPYWQPEAIAQRTAYRADHYPFRLGCKEAGPLAVGALSDGYQLGVFDGESRIGQIEHRRTPDVHAATYLPYQRPHLAKSKDTSDMTSAIRFILEEHRRDLQRHTRQLLTLATRHFTQSGSTAI